LHHFSALTRSPSPLKVFKFAAFKFPAGTLIDGECASAVQRIGVRQMQNRIEDLSNPTGNSHECDLIQALIEINEVHAESTDYCQCRVCQIARKALNGIIAHC